MSENKTKIKPIIDPEWAERFNRNVEAMVAAMRRDAEKAGAQFAKSLASFARSLERRP